MANHGLTVPGAWTSRGVDELRAALESVGTRT